jgi:hypothetical protein
MMRSRNPFTQLFSTYRIVTLVILFGMPLSLQAQVEEDDTTSHVEVGPVEIVDSTVGVTDEVKTYDTDPVKYFSEIEYQDEYPKIHARQAKPGAVQDEKKEKAFWYADLAPDGKKPAEEEDNSIDIRPARTRLTDQTWFQSILWFIIIGGFATCIGIYLSSNNVGIFRRKNVQMVMDGDGDIPEDIFAINYQQEIEKARQAGNYRLAVRLHYLRMLKLMSERQVIRYTQDKTNFDYLMQLQGGRYYEDFFRITRDYEYSWYGQFPVSEDMYDLIRQDFDKMEKELSKN